MMKKQLNISGWFWLTLSSVFCLFVLSSCTTTPRNTSNAPVVDRTGSGNVQTAPMATNTRPTSGSYHTVARGETLYSIAKMYNVSVPSLVSANQLADANQINVDQRLLIPGGSIRSAGTQTAGIRPQGGSSTTVVTSSVSADGPKETSVSTVSKTPQTGAQTTVSKPPAAAGNWIWPVTGGKVITRFGANGSKGIEIAAPLGTPVVAADAGKVIFSSNNIRGYGNLVVVRHDSGYLTAYGYNSRLLVKEGDVVKKGDKIAEVGSSGTDSPKLHFEIRNPQSKPEDPLQYLPK